MDECLKPEEGNLVADYEADGVSCFTIGRPMTSFDLSGFTQASTLVFLVDWGGLTALTAPANRLSQVIFLISEGHEVEYTPSSGGNDLAFPEWSSADADFAVVNGSFTISFPDGSLVREMMPT